MRGLIVVNGYARDPAYRYQAEQMRDAFARLGVETLTVEGNSYPVEVGSDPLVRLPQGDFCLFWDKDTYLLEALDRTGIPLFNPAKSIRICDDKAMTHLALSAEGIPMPKTIPAPLCYLPNAEIPPEEADRVGEELGYPLVVKKSYGSLGVGVWLAEDKETLLGLMNTLKLTPHLYQSYIAASRGRDLRVIVVGETILGGMMRQNETDFRSNIGAGGVGIPCPVPPKAAEYALRAVKTLGLAYAGLDFLLDEGGEPLLCEVNSNAYFKAFAGATGIPVADIYAAHIVKSLGGV